MFCLFIDDITKIYSSECDPPTLEMAEISSLLYADDLVILSTTQHGMQKALNKLNTYCEKWHLDINLEKTKIVVFKHSAKLDQLNNFVIGVHKVKQVEDYTYLGIQFTCKGNFQQATTLLKDKAQKAWFSARSALMSGNVNDVDTMLKIFDATIKPILTYGCEVWGQEYQSNLNFAKNSIEISPFEMLHNKVCKNILGVRANCSGRAAKAELGRLPLIMYIVQMACNYYRKISLNKSKLTYNALASEIQLHNSGKKSWITFVDKIMAQIAKTHKDIPQTKTDTIITLLRYEYIKEFFNIIQSEKGTTKNYNNKLRTYALIKTNYNPEKYLYANIPRSTISAIAKLRTSTHNLEIETGRYARPRIPAHQRTCKICNTGKVEDEIHFLLHCPAYNNYRQNLISLIPSPTNIDNDTTKFITILTSQNKEILREMGLFIAKSNKLRKLLLKPP